MQLPPKTQLDRYVIEHRIASGGMGEIYLARDSRLHRRVAIKKLSAESLANETRQRRFEREARLLSKLSHPNICAVHDLLDVDGQLFLVMEYLEGVTLEQKLQDGPLEDEEVLTIASQIASALAAAHRHGIVHRDTKPSNIMLTESGAKLLDFGVAKNAQLLDHDAATIDGGRRARETSLTATGTTLGTLRYMSPEQLRGSEVGPATDVFAFGTVLFEMVAGQPIYDCGTGAEWIASVLREPTPKLNELSDRPIAQLLAPVIEKCCEKSPSDRYPNCGEIETILRAVLPTQTGLSVEEAVTLSANAQAGQASSPRRWMLAGVGGAALALSGAVSLWTFRDRANDTAPPQPVRSYEISLDQPPRAARPDDSALAISGDGRHLIYVADVDGQRGLVLRPLGSVQERILEGTENAAFPFFSPDGQSIGWFTQPGSRLKTMDLETGAMRDLALATLPQGASWGPDDQIVFSSEVDRGLRSISARGGPIVELTTLGNGDQAHSTPVWLDDGSGVLFVAQRSEQTEQGVRTVNELRLWRTGEQTVATLLELPVLRRPQILPDGRVVFARTGGLSVLDFDSRRAYASEPSEVVVDEIALGSAVPAQFAVSRDGLLLYVPATEASRRLLWITPGNEAENLPVEAGPYNHVRISADGRRLIGGTDDLLSLWFHDLATGRHATLLEDPHLEAVPVFLPATADRPESIVFSSIRDSEAFNLYRMGTEPGAQPEALLPPGPTRIVDSVHPDGSELLYVERHRNRGSDLWRVDLEALGRGAGEEAVSELLSTRFDEGYSAISPDGELIAYTSNASGTYEVYLALYPSMQSRRQVSSGGGTGPIWDPDGATLYYRNGNRVLRCAVRRSPRLRTEDPTLLLERSLYENPSAVPQLQWVPEAARFLAIEDDQAEPARLIVVEGWSSSLARTADAPERD